MKRILADRIKRLDTLLVNKENELREKQEFANSPFTQGNINNLREEIYKEKLQIDRSEDVSAKTLHNFKNELDSLEHKINDLRIV